MPVKKIFVTAALALVFVLTSYCEKRPSSEEPPAANLLFEKLIRSKYDSYAVFKWSDYMRLLEKLSSKKFLVLPLNEMRAKFDSTKVIVGIRHDVDLNHYKALEMAKIEQIYGIRTTYFFLATAEYFGSIRTSSIVRSPGLDNLLKEVSLTGAEIGIHNDLISVMVEHNFDPMKFNTEERQYYKSIGIKVSGTASHGSPLAKRTIPNYNIFSDFSKSKTLEYDGKSYPLGRHSLKEYGFEYEAYFIPFNKYFSDSGGRWNHPGGFEGFLMSLDESRAGDRIQILVHPDWWGVR